MIVLLELLIALLEYINLILQLSFFQQEFILSYKYLTYYAGIMLNAFRYLLCSKLRQHNRRVPTKHTPNYILLIDPGFSPWRYLDNLIGGKYTTLAFLLVYHSGEFGITQV